MKVLFAVQDESMSDMIIKKYQNQYKQIISSKNVFYYNSVIKELQKDKSYDCIVIYEELEENKINDYEQLDKIIIDKLDNISDEATLNGKDIPIIIICSDRRVQSDEFLSKIFGMGIYNGLIGDDRNVANVCKLLKTPRMKKEAKEYYKLDGEIGKYTHEDENDVSELEIQNIIAHYMKAPKDDKVYLEIFQKILVQYNQSQLKAICNCLPDYVKTSLSKTSEDFRKIMVNSLNNDIRMPKNTDIDSLSSILLSSRDEKNSQMGPVIIPNKLNSIHTKPVNEEPIKSNGNINPFDLIQASYEQVSNKQALKEKKIKENEEIQKRAQQIRQEEIDSYNKNIKDSSFDITSLLENNDDKKQNEVENIIKNKIENSTEGILDNNTEIKQENINQFNFDNSQDVKEINNLLDNSINLIDQNNDNLNNEVYGGKGMINPFAKKEKKEENDANYNGSNQVQNPFSNNVQNPFSNNVQNPFASNNQNMQDMNQNSFGNPFGNPQVDNNQNMNPNMNQNSFGSDNQPQNPFSNNQSAPVNPFSNNQNVSANPFSNNQNVSANPFGNTNVNQTPTQNMNNMANIAENANVPYTKILDISRSLGQDKKIATFIGSTKNGTSFIINNLAQLMSNAGVKTAILDTTENRNSYYVYTNNDEKLRNIAQNSINELTQGRVSGININENLTVFTSLPEEKESLNNVDQILNTLAQNYQLILIDTDFNSNPGYFAQTQDIYLVQSMDVLTIQPLTTFLKDLKEQGYLDENKIRVILNKVVKIKQINEKTIIGGMSCYNNSSMSYMVDLFDKDLVKYISIPFDMDVYVKYLESMIFCDVSLKGYPKQFINCLKELGNMVYPLANQKTNNMDIGMQENRVQNDVFSNFNNMNTPNDQNIMNNPFANPMQQGFGMPNQEPVNPFANPQNPFGMPDSNPFDNQIQNPFGMPNQNPMQNPMQNPYDGQIQNPFANPQNPQSNQNPFAGSYQPNMWNNNVDLQNGFGFNQGNFQNGYFNQKQPQEKQGLFGFGKKKGM